MGRPKSDAYVPLRAPSELLRDIEALIALTPGKSTSDWIKEACEFRLKFVWAVRADWYQLRTLNSDRLGTQCVTSGVDVTPKS